MEGSLDSEALQEEEIIKTLGEKTPERVLLMKGASQDEEGSSPDLRNVSSGPGAWSCFQSITVSQAFPAYVVRVWLCVP